MDWARILAYVTGTVDQDLLARNEYLATENPKGHPESAVKPVSWATSDRGCKGGSVPTVYDAVARVGVGQRRLWIGSAPWPT
jgi:hypothetical protein